VGKIRFANLFPRIHSKSTTDDAIENASVTCFDMLSMTEGNLCAGEEAAKGSTTHFECMVRGHSRTRISTRVRFAAPSAGVSVIRLVHRASDGFEGLDCTVQL
jgi:hypothetical protein